MARLDVTGEEAGPWSDQGGVGSWSYRCRVELGRGMSRKSWANERSLVQAHRGAAPRSDCTSLSPYRVEKPGGVGSFPGDTLSLWELTATLRKLRFSSTPKGEFFTFLASQISIQN